MALYHRQEVRVQDIADVSIKKPYDVIGILNLPPSSFFNSIYMPKMPYTMAKATPTICTLHNLQPLCPQNNGTVLVHPAAHYYVACCFRHFFETTKQK